MITVDFQGNSYRFSNGRNGGIWVGNGGPNRGGYPGLHMVVPSIMWPKLFAAAIEAGYEKSELIVEKVVKKASKKRVAKIKKNEIAIF